MSDETHVSAEKKRKTRSDAGIPKEGFMVLVTKDTGEKYLLHRVEQVEADQVPTLKTFQSLADLSKYMAMNAKLGEEYQPVVPLGKAFALKQAVMVV